MIAAMTGRAVVTGAARGIGAAIAARLERDDYEVIRLDRQGGPGVIECDVADAAAVQSVAEHVGPVDALVNNAGIWLFDALENVSPEDFAAPFAVNVRGAFHCAQSFGRSMLARGSGAIVNVVSIAAYRANPGVGGYGPSKAALLSLTEQMALEWGPRGVRCNAVGPGLVPTPGTRNVYDDPEVRAVRAGAVPLRRLADPGDIANVVAFLLSADASYVNGQVIYVDGGISKALMALLPRPYGS
jgi:NAD(P)-dependent dehydrogenase (short-subunit alcohol dehydrogenase family)